MDLVTSLENALSLPCESTAVTAKYHVPGDSDTVVCSEVAPGTSTGGPYTRDAVP